MTYYNPLFPYTPQPQPQFHYHYSCDCRAELEKILEELRSLRSVVEVFRMQQVIDKP